MNIGVFTSNQRRHVALLFALQEAGHTVRAVIEPRPLQGPTMDLALSAYWSRVREAETALFPGTLWTPEIPIITVPMGEASALWGTGTLTAFFPCERLVVFGSSFLYGPLADWLIGVGALNLHVGISPEYRGSAPNMWAHYDGRDDLIGAQVQRLSHRLDAGAVLAEVRPEKGGDDYFRHAMRAAAAGIDQLVVLVNAPILPEPLTLDGRSLVRYSRYRDFTSEIAQTILARVEKETTS